MTESTPLNAPSRGTPDTHQRGRDKVARIPVKVQPMSAPGGESDGAIMPPGAPVALRKPEWIRANL